MSVLRVPVLIIFAFCLMLVSACGSREPEVIKVPREISSVVTPFLKEMRAGNKAKAEELISETALDEFAKQYVSDQKKLAASPELKPRFISPEKPSEDFVGIEKSVVYAAQKNGKWTTATIRLYSYDNSPYEVEYVRVTHDPPAPVMQSKAEEKIFKQMAPALLWSMLALGVFGAVGIVFLLWLVKRRPKIVSPDIEEETRNAAITVREVGDTL